jgi:hypothetical protein
MMLLEFYKATERKVREKNAEFTIRRHNRFSLLKVIVGKRLVVAAAKRNRDMEDYLCS